jgi:hypothetical protein
MQTALQRRGRSLVSGVSGLEEFKETKGLVTAQCAV